MCEGQNVPAPGHFKRSTDQGSIPARLKFRSLPSIRIDERFAAAITVLAECPPVADYPLKRLGEFVQCAAHGRPVGETQRCRQLKAMVFQNAANPLQGSFVMAECAHNAPPPVKWMGKGHRPMGHPLDRGPL